MPAEDTNLRRLSWYEVYASNAAWRAGRLNESRQWSDLALEHDPDSILALSLAARHIGDAGKNGPVATFVYHPMSATTQDGLLPAATVNNSTLVAGTLTDLLDVMTGGFAYVNFHTIANPGGEIRGQVVG